jgi:hypothetical protein
VTNFNVTAAAFAREDVALAQFVPGPRHAQDRYPALASLDTALPSLRAFAHDALPGVRSSDPTLAASMPFITQARLLMSEDELRGTARILRQTIPDLVRFDQTSVPFLRESRALSACTNNVLVPLMGLKIPNPETGNEAENSDQPIRAQLQRGMPGLSGESRLSDGNNQYFHAGATPPGNRVRPGPPPDGGSMPMPHRPDVPCETQELPNMHAPGGPIAPSRFSTRLRVRSQAAGAGAELPDMITGAGLVDNVLPLVATIGPRTSVASSSPKAGLMATANRRTWLTSSRSGAVVLGPGKRTSSSNQRLRFPPVEKAVLMVKAEMPDAQAVTPYQGQTVVTAVCASATSWRDLADGAAVVTLQLTRSWWQPGGRHRCCVPRRQLGQAPRRRSGRWQATAEDGRIQV